MATITTRAGKGSPLTNTEVDANFTNLNNDKIENVVEDTTPQLGGNLDTNGNDITFGDNDKAIFGAGSDLQIYHDGTNSIITETGTGDLRIAGANKVELRQSGSSKVFLDCNANGAVQLRYNNGEKLATTSTGIDVTGTVTADGLTVDGTAAITDNASNGGLTVEGSLSPRVVVEDTTNNAQAFLEAGDSITRVGSLSNHSLELRTNNAEAVRIDSNGKVGIGTSSPDTKAHIVDTNNSATNYLNSDATLLVTNNGTGDAVLKLEGTSSIIYGTGASALRIGDRENERMRIDASGNVGIGTASPESPLNVYHATENNIATLHSGDTNCFISFRDNTTSGDGYVFVGAEGDDLKLGAGSGTRMLIDSAGEVTIGTGTAVKTLNVYGNDGSPLLLQGSGNDTAILFSHSNVVNGAINSSSDGAIEFRVGGSSAIDEAMRIDSSGNLLVGTTDSTPYDNTSGNGIALGDGLISVAQTGGNTAIFNRMSTDGSIISFRKDGTTVGSIATENGHLFMEGGVEGATSTVSYPTDNATVNLLTLAATGVAKVSLVFDDGNYRQGIWAGEFVFFTSDASGSPSVQGNVIEIYNQVGSENWNSPVFTVSNSGTTLTFNATNSNLDMNGTIFIYVYFCTDYNKLTFA